MRTTITQPDDWVEAWREAAEKAGQSLSEWIGDRCNEGLPVRVRRQLSDRRGPGKPPESGQ